MLEHVAANQTRFVAPGISADARGIALGRFVVALLPSVDRVVSLFRGLSEKTSIDELLPSLRIVQVMTPLRSREFLVQLPAGSSYAADSVSAVAYLVGGLTFVGSAKHFVKYRDSSSPLGYDVDSLHSGVGDFVLYSSDFVQVYTAERELDFRQLASSLSLQAVRQDQLEGGEQALLRVTRGLWRAVLGYLYRNNIDCSAAAGEAPRAAGAAGGGERFYLIRCERLPERMASLFSTTPGVEVHRLKNERVAVQLGYRHPFELSSCGSIFAEDRFYVFSGGRDRLEVLDRRPDFVAADALVHLAPGGRPATTEAEGSQLEAVKVQLRLVPSSGPQPRVVGLRMPLQEGDRLKRLVYVLPPNVLHNYGICLTDEHIYLYAESGVDFIPLGEMFWAAAAGVMLPVGFQLVPRVHPDVLRQHLKATAEQLFFFSYDAEGPLCFERSDFARLGRVTLSELEVRQPQRRSAPIGLDIRQAELVNDEVGVFPLWGFSDETEGE